MGSETGKHREKFQVLFYHLDRRGEISLRSIMNFMQSAANMHGKTIGTSVADFSEKGLTWVFSRFHIRMWRYPEQYENLTAVTWRTAGPGKCFACREFQLFDEGGSLAGEASALAVLIDKKNRKPVDIPDFMQKQFLSDGNRAINDSFQPLPSIVDEIKKRDFHVRMSDIDVNQHVNNTSYAEWITESLPEEVLMNCRLLSCEIAYKAEALYGDSVEGISGQGEKKDRSPEKQTFLHRLVRKSDGREITKARTEWMPVQE